MPEDFKQERYVDPNSGAAPQPGGQISQRADEQEPPEERLRNMPRTPEELEENREHNRKVAQQNAEEAEQADGDGEDGSEGHAAELVGSEQELDDPEPVTENEEAVQQQIEEGDNVIASTASGVHQSSPMEPKAEHSDKDLDNMSREELLDVARDMDLSGVSQMRKSELRERIDEERSKG